MCTGPTGRVKNNFCLLINYLIIKQIKDQMINTFSADYEAHDTTA